jgi:NAD(P)H-hydrate epimerase
MTSPLPSDSAGRIAYGALDRIVALAARATVVGCGPGLGRSPGLTALVARLYQHLAQPMVVDADALNALSAQPRILAHPGGPRIFTPHAGEFARLLGVAGVPDDQRQARSVEFAARCGVVLVLKGHRTLITDGRQQAINPTGNPGMATGGTGDVLTGLITALACQHLSPFDAARLGVYLHGLAGDLAAEELGQESLIARDLIRFLPVAFKAYRRRISSA